MATERTLVLIKPDAMSKGLPGQIINEFNTLGLKMIGLKLVKVPIDIAEKHYEEHKGKQFYEGLIEYITGKYHDDEGVVAIVYSGKNAVEKVRKLGGATNPDKAEPRTIRGKYGKIHTQKNNWHETVIHASDSPSAAEREISLWFKKEELIK